MHGVMNRFKLVTQAVNPRFEFFNLLARDGINLQKPARKNDV
tara:strand:- start:863 stop:988 length:126 start_codon:yes stop_codon:yes gene_type:complete